MRQHEREYSNATASRSPAHLFINVDGLALCDVRRDGSVLVGPATSYSNQNGTPFADAAHLAGAPHLGRSPSRRRPEAFRFPRRRPPRTPGEARRAPSRSRHAPARHERFVAAIRAPLPWPARGALRGEPLGFSRDSFLRPARSRASDRRGRRSPPSGARYPGTRDPLRAGHQPQRRSSGRRLVGPVPRPRPRHPERGAARDGLRPAELPKAPAHDRSDRSLQLRSVVRRLASTARRTQREA